MEHMTKNLYFPDAGDGTGWTQDGSKIDYDPIVVRISSRVYSDGDFAFTVTAGGDETIVGEGEKGLVQIRNGGVREAGWR